MSVLPTEQIEAATGRARRHDEWCCSYLGPSGVPGVNEIHASVFRGMRDLGKAIEYAEEVAGFFGSIGLAKPVFVVAGPTSTSSSAYEVVSASAGYRVMHRVVSTPLDAVAEAEKTPDVYERPRA